MSEIKRTAAAIDPSKLLAETEPRAGRDNAVARIRHALRDRTGRAWSVRGGRGTSWGYIDITAPPARRGEYGRLSEADQLELANALGLPLHMAHGGVMVDPRDRDEYVARAEGTHRHLSVVR